MMLGRVLDVIICVGSTSSVTVSCCPMVTDISMTATAVVCSWIAFSVPLLGFAKDLMYPSLVARACLSGVWNRIYSKYLK